MSATIGYLDAIRARYNCTDYRVAKLLERNALADPWGRRFGPVEIGLLPTLWQLASTAHPAQAALFPEPDRAEALRLLAQASTGSSRRR